MEATRAIFYCKNCGRDEKTIGFNKSTTDEFNCDGKRCLGVYDYKDGWSEILGVYFYVMDTNQPKS